MPHDAVGLTERIRQGHYGLSELPLKRGSGTSGFPNHVSGGYSSEGTMCCGV